MSGLDFTAIDFETANGSRASACSVGLARVVGGEIVETVSWLIRPPADYDAFAPANIRVHGITADQVSTAPDWIDVLPQVMAFSGGSSFVAHNAPFDESVFSSVTTASGLAVPSAKFFCSLELSERQMQLADYKLPTVAGALSVPLLNHHDACADATACAHVVLGIARLYKLESLGDLWHDQPLRARTRTARVAVIPTVSYTASKKLSQLPQANPDADQSSPIYGHVFVFTGDLTSMDRDAAMEAVAKHGGSNGNNVTKKTTILVAATTDTGKERKARDYIAAGQGISIISEQEFRVMIATADSVLLSPTSGNRPERRVPVVAAAPQPVRKSPVASLPSTTAPPVSRDQQPAAQVATVTSAPKENVPAEKSPHQSPHSTASQRTEPTPKRIALTGTLLGLGRQLLSAFNGKHDKTPNSRN